MSDDEGMTCGSVYLLRAMGRCHACDQPTSLFALMALAPFTFADDEEEPLDDDGFMLRNLVDVDAALVPLLAEHTGGLLRPDDSQTARLTYWMNHCEHCDAKQGDHFVQGPDGPFWPYTDEESDAIEGVRLEGPFALGDASCSVGPMNQWLDRKLGVPPLPQPKRRKKAPKATG
jgi:hypothetical protein